jgi:hypothetical protein
MTKAEFLSAYHADDGDEIIRSALLDDETWLSVLADGFLAESVSLNKHLPIRVLERLARHSDSRIRGMVADKRASKTILATLAEDSDASVRLRVAANRKADKEILLQLTTDPEPAVRTLALERLEDWK